MRNDLLLRSVLVGCTLALACGPVVRWNHDFPIWKPAPARACPRLDPIGALSPPVAVLGATACGPDRLCLVAAGPRKPPEYLELSLTGDLRIDHAQPLPLPPGELTSNSQALITHDELIVSHGGLRTPRLTAFSTNGQLQWQASVDVIEHRWQGLAITDDSVAALLRGPAMTLHFFDRRHGGLRRSVELGTSRNHFRDGCLERVGDHILATWIDDHDVLSPYHLLSAWVSVATGDIERQGVFTGEGLGHHLACARQGDAIGVLVLADDGTMFSLRESWTPGTPMPRRIIKPTKNRLGLTFENVQLVASGEGFAAVWNSLNRGLDLRTAPTFFMFLDRQGHPTRIKKRTTPSSQDLLVAGPHGPVHLAMQDDTLTFAELQCAR